MFDLIVGVLIGFVFGWYVPQPEWFKNMVTEIKSRIAKNSQN